MCETPSHCLGALIACIAARWTPCLCVNMPSCTSIPQCPGVLVAMPSLASFHRYSQTHPHSRQMPQQQHCQMHPYRSEISGGSAPRDPRSYAAFQNRRAHLLLARCLAAQAAAQRTMGKGQQSGLLDSTCGGTRRGRLVTGSAAGPSALQGAEQPAA